MTRKQQVDDLKKYNNQLKKRIVEMENELKNKNEKPKFDFNEEDLMYTSFAYYLFFGQGLTVDECFSIVKSRALNFQKYYEGK